VNSGGPADNAGLQGDDIITSIGGYPVKTTTDLTIACAIIGQGSSVNVNFVNAEGVSQSAQITLGVPSAANSFESFDYL
jgi:S1-C subfamily serine protease